MARSHAALRQLLGDTEPEVKRDEKPNGEFFGVERVDRLVRCDLGRSLHIFGAENARDFGLVAGFSLAVLSRLRIQNKTIVWVTQSLAGMEGGRLHGCGIQEMAMRPSDFIWVDAKRSADVLWAIEECLASKAVAAVVGEVLDDGAIELTATRRIALRSERSGVPAYIVTARSSAGVATAARTRWSIGPLPSRTQTLLGAPSWSLKLIKNRSGPCGEALLGYSPSSCSFFPPQEPERMCMASPSPSPDAPAMIAPGMIAPGSSLASMNCAVVRLATERRRNAEFARERS